MYISPILTQLNKKTAYLCTRQSPSKGCDETFDLCLD